MMYYSRGGAADVLDGNALREGLYAALDKLGALKKVLAIPPDFTRFHSQAGVLTGSPGSGWATASRTCCRPSGRTFP